MLTACQHYSRSRVLSRIAVYQLPHLLAPSRRYFFSLSNVSQVVEANPMGEGAKEKITKSLIISV
jgi:hypothetical protein